MQRGSKGFGRLRRSFLLLAAACLGLMASSVCAASEVVVIGDTGLKPVAEVVSGLNQTLKATTRLYSYNEVRGDLDKVVGREGARVVVALGKEALSEALKLPPSITVVYGLTVLPPQSSRPNTCGTIMATPVPEYLSLLARYLPSLRKVGAVGTQELFRAVGVNGNPQISAEFAANPVEFVSRIKQLDGADAVLLLPDPAMLTAAALEECYLYSFRRKVPLLGISEKHVKEGALLALTFDPLAAGRQIGELTSEALAGADLGRLTAVPPRRYDLFLNTDTARMMGITLPADLLKRAKRVYP